MERLNQIKFKLLEMEGGIFQRLCDDWLYRKGYENINPIGMMSTTNRVVKGTPDSLFIQPNGKYIFTEYTVQQDRLAQKIEEDIYKCFDEIKTGISNENIEGIIVCYLGKLSLIEINNLKNICHSRDVLLTLFGLDTIALSIQNNYPILSEIYLSLSLDTGQLLSVDDFVVKHGQNRLTTSIDNPMLFQEDALKYAITVLDSANFLLVSGAAGVGKTLFSVNVVKILQDQSDNLKVICLFDKGADLIRDITANFSEPNDYLIFIDDANRLDNRLDYLLHFFHEKGALRKFRIIATVRDYARESLIEKVKQYVHVHEQFITPLSGDQIRKLVDAIFGIKNVEYQERIEEIACGNARLAVMASQVVIKTNQIESIQNVASLYDDYFGQHDSVRTVVQDKSLMATACAISFFRKVDKFNDLQMTRIQNSFGIQAEEFWEHVNILHKHEMVDLYENEVVKMSDQILSTYLFYLSIFEQKIIPFSVIVKDFYPDFTKTIIDSLNPVISSFDHKKIISNIRDEIKSIFIDVSNLGKIEKAIEFLNTFWFSLPTESLIFVKGVISEMPTIEMNWKNEVFIESKNDLGKNKLVSLLTKFRVHTEANFKISFDLLLKYLERDKDSLGFIVRSFGEHYSFKADDWKYNYFTQNHIVDCLIERMDGGKNYLFTRLFIIVANAFLKVEHRQHQWTRGDALSIITFRLSPDDDLLQLREKLIKGLSTLINEHEYHFHIMEILRIYVNRVRHEGKEMAEADLKLFSEHLITHLNKENLTHCLVMQSYCYYLDSLKVSFPKEWRKIFSNEAIALRNLLLEDKHESKMLEMGYEEYNKYRHQCLTNYFTGITYEQFQDFINKCVELNQALSGRDREYLLKNGVEMSLKAVAQSEPSVFPSAIILYLDYDDCFEINPHNILNDLFNLLPSEVVWELINAKEYKFRRLWCSTFFALLPKNAVTQEMVHRLIEHVSNSPSNQLRGWLDYLDKYKVIDSKIYQKIVKILVDKSKDDEDFARSLGHLFSSQSDDFGKWFDDLELDEELVFNAYLAAFKVNQYWDHSGEAMKILVERRFEFLFAIIDQMYEKERWPDVNTNMTMPQFLWSRDSYLEDVESYGKYICKKSADTFSLNENIFCKLFIKNEGEVEGEGNDIIQKKELFFRFTIENNASDIEYICFIFHAAQYLHEKFRRELLKLFIAHNSNFNDFKTLDYKLVTTSWSGSHVPILEREKNFLESLLPIFNSIELLEHKAYVEGQIEHKIKYIEREKKRDFLESR